MTMANPDGLTRLIGLGQEYLPDVTLANERIVGLIIENMELRAELDRQKLVQLYGEEPS